jgi:hypothetical protein
MASILRLCDRDARRWSNAVRAARKSKILLHRDKLQNDVLPRVVESYEDHPGSLSLELASGTRVLLDGELFKTAPKDPSLLNLHVICAF